MIIPSDSEVPRLQKYFHYKTAHPKYGNFHKKSTCFWHVFMIRLYHLNINFIFVPVNTCRYFLKTYLVFYYYYPLFVVYQVMLCQSVVTPSSHLWHCTLMEKTGCQVVISLTTHSVTVTSFDHCVMQQPWRQVGTLSSFSQENPKP